MFGEVNDSLILKTGPRSLPPISSLGEALRTSPQPPVSRKRFSALARSRQILRRSKSSAIEGEPDTSRASPNPSRRGHLSADQLSACPPHLCVLGSPKRRKTGLPGDHPEA